MGGSRSRQSALSAFGSAVPVDLVLVVVVTLTTLVVAFGFDSAGSPLRVALGLVFVLFSPGYALVSVLFPTDGDAQEAPWFVPNASSEETIEISGTERVVLSLGLSVAVVPLVGLVLNFTPWGIERLSVLLVVALLTLLLTVVAAFRRWQYPPYERFRIGTGAWLSDGLDWAVDTGSLTETALNVALVFGLVLAASGVVFVIAAPKQGEQFTEFYLLTEDPESGELVADGYPRELTAGEEVPLVVGLTNDEHRTVNYTVVVELQQVAVESGNVSVVEETRLHRFVATVRHNETWQRPHTVQPGMTGDRLRLTYLLYEGSPPESPTADNAYRTVHIWVNVSEESAPASQRPQIAVATDDGGTTAYTER